MSETSRRCPRPVRVRACSAREDADGRVQPADHVDERGADLQRPAVRLAGDRHQPAHGLQQQVVAGQRAARSPEPKALIEQCTTPGLTAAIASWPRPRRSNVPGRKDSTTTSARAHRRRASSRSPCVLEVEHDRALVAVQAEEVGRALGGVGGPQLRVSSPPPGRSTLTTSAPRSPSVIVHSGPARTREKSATSRPSSAPGAGRARRGRVACPRGADRRRLRPAPRRAHGRRRPAPAGRRSTRCCERVARRRAGSCCSATRSSCATGRCATRSPPPRRCSARSARRSATAEVVLVAGNHDHGLVAPWLEARGARGAPPPLGLEQRAGPARREAVAARWRDALAARAALEVAYPGVWLRDDVYAIHGHYLDRHSTVPTAERLAAGALARVLGARADEAVRPDDYELVLAPAVRAARRRRARARPTGSVRHNAGTSTRAWRALAGARRRPLRRWLAAGAFPLGRRGAQPRRPRARARRRLRRGAAPRRAAGDARGRRPARRSDARHVLFGHTHRAGPLAGDDLADWALARRRLAAQLRLVGATTAPYFDPAGQGPYRPGRGGRASTATAPPRLVRLLDERPPRGCCSGARPGPAPGAEAHGQARRRPSPALEVAARPRVLTGCDEEHVARPGARRRGTRR